MQAEDIQPIIETCLSDPETVGVWRTALTPLITKVVTELMAERNAVIDALTETIAEQQKTINELEQYSRKNCINIAGAKETERESVRKLTKDIGRAVGVNLTDGDIDTAHQLGRHTDGKVRPIIVKFTTFDKRQEFYQARRKLRGASTPVDSSLSAAELSQIFVSDSLTKANRSVMYAARQLKNDGKLAAAWTDAGRMKIRIVADGPTRVIRGLDELRSIDPDHAVFTAPAAGQPGAARATTQAAAAGGVSGGKQPRAAAAKSVSGGKPTRQSGRLAADK